MLALGTVQSLRGLPSYVLGPHDVLLARVIWRSCRWQHAGETYLASSPVSRKINAIKLCKVGAR